MPDDTRTEEKARPYPFADPFRERYLTDPNIKAVTDTLVYALISERLTAHDLARCAVLAAQIYAEKYAAPLTIVLGSRNP